MRYLKILTVIFALSALFLSLPVAGNAAKAKMGEEAPDFTLPVLGGGEFKLSAMKGKSSVLLVLFQSACSSCRSELKWLNEAEKGDVEIIAVNVDSKGGMEATSQRISDYMKALGVNHKVILDPQFSVGRMYGVGATPVSILVDKDGKFSAMEIGYVGEESKPAIEKMLK